MRILPFRRLADSRNRNWERVLASAASGDTVAVLRDARDTLTAILLDNLLPFWTERVRGVMGNYPVLLAEERDGGRRLNLILVSRYLWFVSLLANSKYAKEAHTDLAHEAYSLLTKRLHDDEHGGFFWEVSVDTGRTSKPGKHLYGQAFAIFALSQYAETTGDQAAAHLANTTFSLIDAHAHDGVFGGYRESFQADWQPDRGMGYLGRTANFKLVNTHIHILEAWTSLFQLAPETTLHNRITELIDILSRRTVINRFDVAVDCYLPDWQPLRERRNRRISYGHDLECIHLLGQASAAVRSDPEILASHYQRRFSYCMRFGFDFERGGFFKHGPPGRRANNRQKVWWVQAEALLAALYMYRLTRERHYLAAFERTLDWLKRFQIDWQHGEWHREVDPAGRPRGVKADRWKGPYHNGRSTLACLGIIDGLLAPTAGRDTADSA